MAKVTGVQPKALRDRPQKLPELMLPRRVFATLSRARKWTDGQPLPIEISEFMALCGPMGVKGELLWTLLSWVQDMDDVYLKHFAEKAKERANSTESAIAGGGAGRG